MVVFPCEYNKKTKNSSRACGYFSAPNLTLLIDFHVPHESLVVPGALLVEVGKCLSSLFAVKSVASAGE